LDIFDSLPFILLLLIITVFFYFFYKYFASLVKLSLQGYFTKRYGYAHLMRGIQASGLTIFFD